MTNDQVFKAFINGATSGKNGKGSLFIKGDTLYSYGKHWPLAMRFHKVMTVNEDRCSVTTSKQTSQFVNACIRAGMAVDYASADDMRSRFAFVDGV